MTHRMSFSRARLLGFSLVLVSGAAIVLSGCPPTYEVETGDWIIHQTPFPIHITFGLTLNPDGSAVPYEAVPGYGSFPGEWTWATNGVSIWFYQSYDGDEYTYSGTLLSETAAMGYIYHERSRFPIGEWEAVRDDQ